MACLRLCLFAALTFAAQSLQQATKDPINDFCRRWGHQTAEVDGKLYVDGGLVAWNPLSSNSENSTNTWLLYSNLNSSTQDVGMPRQYANLTKGSNVPSVAGGALWADEVNKCFYLFGGQYQQDPEKFSFWLYDTILNQWNETKYTSNVNSIQRVSYGAGTQINELGLGFYYGGWLNNQTTPGWTGPSIATSNLIQYDYNEGTLNNNTGPDAVGRAEGEMLYLPASDGGLLVYFGGVEDKNRNGTVVGANMSTIHIFDISSSKWYKQEASGDIPASRRQFCAGVTWADDYSSYNIYLYGGFGIQDVAGYDDAYILSLPSFTWIRAWKADNTTQYPHGACSANVINRDQMLIIGGWFPTADICDSPGSQGQHNMNLGYNGAAKTIWDKYDPKITTYFVPTPVISAIGGGPTGGASITKPSTWNNEDLAVYFTRVPKFSARTATRPLPSETGSSGGGGGGKSNVGAIAGGVVGGLVGLIAILSLILFCLHRRKKKLKQEEANKETTTTTSTTPMPPAELAATPSVVHRMSSPGAKHLSMQHPPDSGTHLTTTGDNPLVSPLSPYQPQSFDPSSPLGPAPYPSTYGNEYPQQAYQQHNAYPSYPDNSNVYDSQSTSYNSNHYPPPSAAALQRQYSYPTPTSPTHPPFATQQPQVYYPPPPEPSTGTRSRHSGSDRVASTEGTQYSGDSRTTPLPPSTTATPAHFYAQPVPIRPQPVVPEDRGLSPSPRWSGDEAGNTGEVRSDVSYRGSNTSSRKPVRGRFVEGDDL